MTDTRKKNYSWCIDTTANGNTPKEDARLAVLMDIRDELQILNCVFRCHNFLDIPFKLDAIKKNTTKKKIKKKAKRGR